MGGEVVRELELGLGHLWRWLYAFHLFSLYKFFCFRTSIKLSNITITVFILKYLKSNIRLKSFQKDRLRARHGPSTFRTQPNQQAPL